MTKPAAPTEEDGSQSIGQNRRAEDGIRPLRILFVNHDYWPTLGGVPTYTHNLARALRDRGHAIAIVADGPEPDHRTAGATDGIPLSLLPFSQALSKRDSSAIALVTARFGAIKQEFRPNVVHVNFPTAAAFFQAQSPQHGESTVCLFHCALGDWPGVWGIARTLADRADVLAVPSHFIAGNIAGVVSRRPEQFRVLEHGVPEAALLPIPPLPERPPPRFLFAGRLTIAKGPQTAIDAVHELAGRGYPARLEVAGTGEFEAEMRRLCGADPQLSRCIAFLGQLPEAALVERFRDATALLVPSLSKESFSLVAVEAAFAGRPVLASRRGALPETVLDGETGLLFEVDNFISLADAMQRLIEEPGLAAGLGERGRERASERYRLTSMVDRYEALYRELS